MPKIRLVELYAYYGKGKNENLVIEEMTDFFPSNQISVIVGPSGCGKTTLLKAMLGILEYDGDIFFDDKDIYDIPTEKRNMAYISQYVNLYPHMTVFDNIAFPLKNKKLPREEILTRVRDIAKKFKIEHCLNVRGRYLSIGQQQRAMLARELVSNPSVVLMDEPVSHLDPVIKQDILNFIKELNKTMKLTIIYVTHSFSEAALIGDVIYVMENGKFVEKGNQKKLLSSNNEFVKALISSEQYEKKD